MGLRLRWQAVRLTCYSSRPSVWPILDSRGCSRTFRDGLGSLLLTRRTVSRTGGTISDLTTVALCGSFATCRLVFLCLGLLRQRTTGSLRTCARRLGRTLPCCADRWPASRSGCRTFGWQTRASVWAGWQRISRSCQELALSTALQLRTLSG